MIATLKSLVVMVCLSKVAAGSRMRMASARGVYVKKSPCLASLNCFTGIGFLRHHPSHDGTNVLPTQPSLSKRSPSSLSKKTSRNSAKVGSISHGACSSAPVGKPSDSACPVLTIFTRPSFAVVRSHVPLFHPVLLTLELVSLLSSTCPMEMHLGSDRWVVGVC